MAMHLGVLDTSHYSRTTAPDVQRNRGDRGFDIHPIVHGLTVGSYLVFVGVLITAFMGPDLVVPAGIFVVGVIALFLTPAMWLRVRPDDGLRKQSWSEFMGEGIECLTGKLSAVQALSQILVLPALLVALAFVMAVIKLTL